MRQILVDRARGHRAAKRGGGYQLELSEASSSQPGLNLDLVDLDDALNELALLDAQQARIVELRFFGGVSIEDPHKSSAFPERQSSASGPPREPGCDAKWESKKSNDSSRMEQNQRGPRGCPRIGTLGPRALSGRGMCQPGGERVEGRV
jgi:hypothetical protein